jgi:hypothetical protein
MERGECTATAPLVGQMAVGDGVLSAEERFLDMAYMFCSDSREIVPLPSLNEVALSGGKRRAFSGRSFAAPGSLRAGRPSAETWPLPCCKPSQSTTLNPGQCTAPLPCVLDQRAKTSPRPKTIHGNGISIILLHTPGGFLWRGSGLNARLRYTC